MIWILVAVIGLTVSLIILSTVLRNFRRESYDPKGGRFRIARAHLRRTSLRLVRQAINLSAGVVAVFTPPPVHRSVTVALMLITFGLIFQAALDTADVIMDYALIRRLFAI